MNENLENTYDVYDKEINETLRKYSSIQEQKDYLYKQKAFLNANASATWIWNVISIIISISSIILANVVNGLCTIIFYIVVMVIIAALGIYRNKELQEINAKLACVDKCINELSLTTK